jgi:O-antigen/teichoic acid export membrane protein
LRLLPLYGVRHRLADQAQYFAEGCRLTLSASLAVSACSGAVLLFWPVSQTAQAVILGLLLGLPFVALEYFFEGVARAMGWFRITLILSFIARPILLMIVFLALAHGGQSIGAALAVTVLAIGVALSCLFTGWVFLRRLPPRSSARNAHMQRRFWMRQSFPLLVASGLDDLLAAADMLAAGLLFAPAQAAIYFISGRIMTLAALVQHAIYFAAARGFSLSMAAGDRSGLQRRLWVGTAQTAGGTMLAAAATMLAAPVILPVFGAHYAPAPALLLALAAIQMARSLGVQAHELLLVAGRGGTATACSATALALFALLAFALPRELEWLALSMAAAHAARSALLLAGAAFLSPRRPLGKLGTASI